MIISSTDMREALAKPDRAAALLWLQAKAQMVADNSRVTAAWNRILEDLAQFATRTNEDWKKFCKLYQNSKLKEEDEDEY